MKWRKLVVKLESTGVHFVYDELDSSDSREKLCDLRKFPALHRLGFGQLTCPKSWQKIDQWSRNQYEFEAPGFVHMDDVEPEENSGDLVAITNQYYEDNYPAFGLEKIINSYANANSRVIVGADSKTFDTYGSKRPLGEMPYLKSYFDYTKVFNAFKDRYSEFGYELPLKYCMNLFVQENALLYEELSGDRLSTAKQVFQVLPEAPYLPLWETLTDIFTSETIQGTQLLDGDERKGLAKWLRRRIELTHNEAKYLARDLNHLARRKERLFNPYYRAETKEMEAARTYIEEQADLAPELSYFRNWIVHHPRRKT